jgi:hypothetical protein
MLLAAMCSAMMQTAAGLSMNSDSKSLHIGACSLFVPDWRLIDKGSIDVMVTRFSLRETRAEIVRPARPSLAALPVTTGATGGFDTGPCN